METNVKYNYQDYLQLPEDKRYEINDGDLFMVPSPNENHQRILANLFHALSHYLKQNKLGRVYFAPFDKTIALAIKVSASAGPVHRYLVGDPQRQVIEAAAGRTLDRLDGALRLTQKGEVLIDHHIAEVLAADVRLSEWRIDESSNERFAVVAELLAPVSDQPWPDLPDVEAEIARSWMLPQVYERLRSGHGQFLAELRSAVTLFLRFDGIDYDIDEAAGHKLDAFVRWVQQVVDHYGGFVLQLSMGEKGSYLQAAVGAPQTRRGCGCLRPRNEFQSNSVLTINRQ